MSEIDIHLGPSYGLGMQSNVPTPGGELERAVLDALWVLGESSARAIHERVGAPTGLAYTTVTKVLDRLCAKGLVARQRQGRIFRFRALHQREKVERALARRVLKGLLGAEPRPAMATLVDAVQDLDPELLDELSRVVRSRGRKDDGS